MKDILDTFIDSLSKGDVLPALVIVAVAFVLNFRKVIEFVEDRKKARIVKLVDALKCEQIKGLTKSHLEDELATEHFKITTGVRLEKDFREAVLKAHRNAHGELRFIHFKRALPHIIFRNSSLNVEISLFDKINYWFNLVFGIILALFGIVLLILPTQIDGIKLVQMATIYSMALFFIGVAIIMLLQTLPVDSARKVAKEIAKTRNKSIESTNS